ncbi:(2Fe-2S)-binding protein [Oceanimonas sp. NS1]|nr:(2Fe-2S)-binding protein [Oceanimonas sp. NS1]
MCSCWSASEAQIQRTIEQHDLTTLAQLQQQLKCGTRCGSCVPELKQILVACRSQTRETST